MATFKDVIGHEQIVEHLKSALKNGKISHAYILNGADGSGKRLIAGIFAKALQCEAGYGDACDMCHSCHQANSDNHPDIHWVQHDKPNTIGVEEIRTQVNSDILIKPYSGKYKIYVIDEAEKLTVQAQNALLKTIEEPPAYGILMFLTNNIEVLLPTIRSRCITLNLKAVPYEQVQSFLMKHYQIPDYKARVCAAFSQGSIGKAVRMATSPDFGELQEDVLRILKHVDNMEVYEIMDAVKNLSEHKVKADIYDIIDMMSVWYRDVLMLKITKDMNLLVYREEYRALNDRAKKSSFDGLDTIIQGFEKAKVRLKANVNFDVAIELMLLTIKEN